MSNRTAMVKLPALQMAWRIYYSLVLLVVGTALGVFVSLFLKEQGSGAAGFLSTLGVALLINVPAWTAAGWVYGGLAFKAFDATLIEGEGVLVRKGVWWRSEIMVPITRLQHIDVNQGPLDRHWSMARLSLHTAGTHDHGTKIYGLPVAQAHALRTTLLPRERLAHD